MKNSINSTCLTLLSLFLLLAVVQTGFAQSPHKPLPGEFGIGLKALGLKGLIWENSFDNAALQFRKVKSEKIVFRADLGLDFHNVNNSNKTVSGGGGSGYVLMEDTERSFSLALAPGLERHFNGSQRLDPYIGVAIPISFDGKTSETTINDLVADNGDYTKSKQVTTTPGGFGVGLDGIVGVNYFVFDFLAVGVEYKLGFSFDYKKGKSNLKTTIKEKIGGAAENVVTSDNDGPEVGLTSFTFGNKGVIGLNLIYYFGSKG